MILVCENVGVAGLVKQLTCNMRCAAICETQAGAQSPLCWSGVKQKDASVLWSLCLQVSFYLKTLTQRVKHPNDRKENSGDRNRTPLSEGCWGV